MTALRHWTVRLLAAAGGIATVAGAAPAQTAAPVVVSQPRPAENAPGVVAQPHVNAGPRRVAYTAPNTPYAAPTVPRVRAGLRARPVAYQPAAVGFAPAPANPAVVNPVAAFNPGFANPLVLNPGLANALAANRNAAARPFFNPGFVNPPADPSRTSPGRNPGGYYDPATGIVLGGAPEFLPWMQD